jgi:predicted transcriptional regulator
MDEHVGRGVPPKETQFKPGQSGNPGGRPRTSVLSAAIRRKLAEIDETDPQQRTFGQIIAEKAIDDAINGDARQRNEARRFLADRAEGKPHQSVSLSTDRRDMIEREVDRIVEEAEGLGEVVTRDDALLSLSKHYPEALMLM